METQTALDNIEIVENAIMDRLMNAEELKGVDIEPYPADISEFDFLSALGCILVRYDNSSYTKPQTMPCVTQDETLEFSVFIGLRYLKAYRDSYPWLKIIKRLLTGLCVKGKRLYPTKRQFVDLVKGDLYWGYSFNITLPAQEDISLNNVIPLWEQ